MLTINLSRSGKTKLNFMKGKLRLLRNFNSKHTNFILPHLLCNDESVDQHKSTYDGSGVITNLIEGNTVNTLLYYTIILELQC